MPKAAFHTLGCKVNQYETEAMMDQFKSNGYKIVKFNEKADIYVINSCTVTTQAASKSRKKARRAKRRNPQSKVVMVGCYPQAFPEEVENINEIDYIIGASGKEELVKLIEEKMEEENNSNNYLKNIFDYNELTKFENLEVKEFNKTTRANIKIEDGCNQFCSYCIIPMARGPIRSREPASIINEINNLIKNGIKEIVLTGTHLGLYGYKNEGLPSLSDLIKKIVKIPKKFRVRLSSIEVTEIDDKLINLIKNNNKICAHLHLPLQSGSDHILEKMNRPYDQKIFRETVRKIRNKIPDIAITTDVMVGFPGETKKHYEETKKFIKEIKFSRLHVFPFSPRAGTPAANMNTQIQGNIKNDRSKELIDLNKKLMKNYQNRFVNQIREVIIEDNRDYKTGMLQGVTDNYIRVLIKDNEIDTGEMVPIKLLNSSSHEYLKGEMV